MDTRKYDKKQRKALKRQQRTPAYRALQQRTAKERTDLEAQMHPLKADLKAAQDQIATLEKRWGDIVAVTKQLDALQKQANEKGAAA